MEPPEDEIEERRVVRRRYVGGDPVTSIIMLIVLIIIVLLLLDILGVINVIPGVGPGGGATQCLPARQRWEAGAPSTDPPHTAGSSPTRPGRRVP